MNEIRKIAKEKNIHDDERLSQLDPQGVLQPGGLQALQRKRHLLPYFYADATTSDLRFTVQPGANTYDIPLQEK